MASNFIPLIFPTSLADSDIIIGKNTVSSSAGLPVPIPAEISAEGSDFSNTEPVRNVEFWHSGKTTFYNYSSIPLFEQATSGQIVVKNSGGTAIATLTSAGALTIPSNANVTGNVTSPGIGTFTTQVISNLGTFANLSAPYKLFDIPHPSPNKPGKRLRHGCLEGPELAVYTRGKTASSIIPVPDFWEDLVDTSTITVHLTATTPNQDLIVQAVRGVEIEIWGNANEPYYYHVMAERKDVPKLEIEIDA